MRNSYSLKGPCNAWAKPTRTFPGLSKRHMWGPKIEPRPPDLGTILSTHAHEVLPQLFFQTDWQSRELVGERWLITPSRIAIFSLETDKSCRK